MPPAAPLSAAEIDTVERGLASLDAPANLTVRLGTDARSEKLRALMKELAAAAKDRLLLTFVEDDRLPCPQLELRPNLKYQMEPRGVLLETLVAVMRRVATGRSKPKSIYEELAAGLQEWRRLQAFVSSHCPHCPGVAKMVSELALASSYIDASIIDPAWNEELAVSCNIRSVPTVVVEGDVRLTGSMGAPVLVDALLRRRAKDLQPESLRYALKQGDAERLAQRFVEEGEINPEALGLLREADWSVRLGMMVVLETVAAAKPGLVRQVLPQLLDLLAHPQPQVRGDVAFLLGRIGNRAAVPSLRRLLADSDGEVAAAAREALASLDKLPGTF